VDSSLPSGLAVRMDLSSAPAVAALSPKAIITLSAKSTMPLIMARGLLIDGSTLIALPSANITVVAPLRAAKGSGPLSCSVAGIKLGKSLRDISTYNTNLIDVCQYQLEAGALVFYFLIDLLVARASVMEVAVEIGHVNAGDSKH
jgi:hypothetical protein